MDRFFLLWMIYWHSIHDFMRTIVDIALSDRMHIYIHNHDAWINHFIPFPDHFSTSTNYKKNGNTDALWCQQLIRFYILYISERKHSPSHSLFGGTG